MNATWLFPFTDRALVLGSLVLTGILSASCPCAVAGEPQMAEQITAFPKVSRESLRYNGKSFDEWRNELLTELKREKRIETIKALTALGCNEYGAEATQALVALMKTYSILRTGKLGDEERSDEVYDAALNALSRIGAPAIPELAVALTHGNQSTQFFAVHALGEVGKQNKKDAKMVAAALKRAANHEDPVIRIEAIDCISDQDAPTEGFVAVLTKAMKDENEDVQKKAIEGLGRIKGHAREPQSILVALMQDEKYKGFRSEILDALCAIQPDLKDIFVAVQVGYQADEEGTTWRARILLAKCAKGGEEAVRPLVAALKKAKDAPSQIAIIRILRDLGPSAKEAVVPLQDFGNKSDNKEVTAATKQAVDCIRNPDPTPTFRPVPSQKN